MNILTAIALFLGLTSSPVTINSDTTPTPVRTGEIYTIERPITTGTGYVCAPVHLTGGVALLSSHNIQNEHNAKIENIEPIEP